MKLRSLLATLSAVCTACAAHAQSSVAIFGTVDATLSHASGSLSTKTQLTSGGFNASRLGFRGEEDLGGGYAAGFYLEAQLNVDDGTGVATNTNNQNSGTGPASAGRQGLEFHRRSTVSLIGPFGELRLGRDYTPQFNSYPFFDPFGVNGLGTSQTLVSALPLVGTTLTRASNTVGYVLPNSMGGFYGQAQVFFGENPSGTPTADDGNGRGLRFGYRGGAINVAFAAGRTDFAGGDTATDNLAATYTLPNGVVLMTMIQQDRLKAAVQVKGRGTLLGFVWPVGVGFFRAAYSDYRTSSTGNPKSAKTAFGYVHNLSKRTAVYGTYAQVRNSGGANQALGGATTATNASSSGYEVGLRLVF